MFQKMGIADEVKAKTAKVKPGEPVGAVVARGDAEIGFQQISELIPVKGIQYLGPLPPEIQNVTVYSGGVHSGTKETDAATALVKFLTAPAAIPTITKHNLEPGSASKKEFQPATRRQSFHTASVKNGSGDVSRSFALCPAN